MMTARTLEYDWARSLRIACRRRRVYGACRSVAAAMFAGGCGVLLVMLCA